MAELPLPSLARLRVQAVAHGHRAVIVLEGSPPWCRTQAAALITAWGEAPILWVGAHGIEPHPCIPWRKATTWLGRELGLLAIDAFDGVDANGLAALSGTLRAGGLWLLLVPSLAKWGDYPDPQHQRLASWPHPADAVSGRFLQRLGAVIQQQPGIVLWREGHPFPAIEAAPAPPPPVVTPVAPPPYAHPEQQQAVAAIEHVVHGHRRRPLVLSADRGRGKSAALGIAAAHLLQQGVSPILLSGPSPDAVAQVFAHAQRLLPEARRQRSELLWQNSRLQFIAPDRLLREQPQAALLLVDEAAAIPLPLLQAMQQHYARLVFATTVHGYEGSGRGFVLRFARYLDDAAPGWQACRIEQAIRWREGDPLEALCRRGLLLDAEAVAEERLTEVNAAACSVEWLDRRTLAQHEADLNALLGLLQLAHYRTSPNDLRHLLDAPGLSLLVVRRQGVIIAAALLGEEGGLASELAEAVYRGERRLHGHLLPQSLAAHAGFPEAATLRAMRIIRLAVHPSCQRQGLGRAMLAAIRQRFVDRDYLGASFGATPELLAFWQRAGYLPLRVGLHREASSGAHALMVATPCSPQAGTLLTAIRQRLFEHLPALLREPLRDLEAGLITALFAASPLSPSELTPQDLRDLHAFAHSQRGYELCLTPLHQLTLQALSRGQLDTLLNPTQRQLLIRKVIQQHDWPQLAAAAGLSGRREVVASLREVCAVLLKMMG